MQPGSELRQRTRAALLWDLALTRRLVPDPAWEDLAGTRIIVNAASVDRAGAGLHGLVTHVSAAWLMENGYEAQRAGAIEVQDAHDYLEWRSEQPMVLLHEMTHVRQLHASDAVRAELAGAFSAAQAGGRYESVEYVLTPGQPRRAYALNGLDEYVAEIAEARFGRNDYAPFDFAALVALDPGGCAAVSHLWKAD